MRPDGVVCKKPAYFVLAEPLETQIVSGDLRVRRTYALEFLSSGGHSRVETALLAFLRGSSSLTENSEPTRNASEAPSVRCWS